MTFGLPVLYRPKQLLTEANNFTTKNLRVSGAVYGEVVYSATGLDLR